MQPASSPPKESLLPAEVEQKLLLAGEQLTPTEWTSLPLVARERLHAMPTNTEMERKTFASLVAWLRQTFAPGP